MFSIQTVAAIAKAIESVKQRICVVFERGCEYHYFEERRESSQELVSSRTLVNEHLVFLAIKLDSDLNICLQ